MKARLAALGATLLGASLMLFVPLKAVFLTPTALSSGLPDPIGIDWNSLTNQLIVSVNWNDGNPLNFNSVDRVSGAQAPWGSQSGWVDEIYFTTVRSGQPGGWTAGRVYSAQGVAPPAADTRTQYIAEFDQNGVLLNGSFATLAGEVRLKRGGITFDRFNVAGLNGALVVLASNDINNLGTPFPDQGTGVYKITSGGVVTKLAELPGHSEGVAVIPNEPKYGAWAGKILIGREPTFTAVALDPVSLVVSDPYTVGFEVEDIWVIPDSHDFYGVDHRGGELTGTVYKIEAAQWKNGGLVGKIVFAQEHGAKLGVAQSPAEPTELVLDINPPIQWEHITFAPAPNVDIIKFTNGADANDPNGTDVAFVAVGGTVTWTYRVTNTGAVSVPKAQVVVTDNVTGVTPAFSSVLTEAGSSADLFEPGDVWLFTATGTALNLAATPPAGTHIVSGCTLNSTQPPQNAYTNIGTVTIPGATDTDPSSYCNIIVREAPLVSIKKFTNGADADDPDGADVPNIVPGTTVTWTYRVTNIGNTSVPSAQVLVTDSVTGLAPAFDSVFLGDADAIFEPNEVWIYKATGPALNLTLPPPAGTTFVDGKCTHSGTEPPRTAYTNIGRVTIPSATDTDPSSYCNPLGNTEARVTGGGSIFATINGVPNVRVTHGLQLRCDPTDSRQSLEINWDGGNNFHLDKIINSVTCYDDPLVQPPPPPNTIVDTYAGNTLFNGKTGYHGFGYAVGTGTCNKIPATIYFILSDAGEPGTADVAEYHIVGGCTLDAGPALIDKGNHQFHKN